MLMSHRNGLSTQGPIRSASSTVDRIESIVRRQPLFSDAQLREIAATCIVPIPKDSVDIGLMVGSEDIWIPCRQQTPRLEALGHKLRNAFLAFMIRGDLDVHRAQPPSPELFSTLKRAIARIDSSLASDNEGAGSDAALAPLLLRAALSHNSGRRGQRGLSHGEAVYPIVADTLSGLDAFDAAAAGVRMIREWVHMAERRSRYLRARNRIESNKNTERLISDLAEIWIGILGQKLVGYSGPDAAAPEALVRRHSAFADFVIATFRALGIQQRPNEVKALVARLHSKRKFRSPSNT